MRDLRGTYVHRSDSERRSRRLRSGLLLVAASLGVIVILEDGAPAPARAESAPFAKSLGEGEAQMLAAQLQSARLELYQAHRKLERWNHIFSYSGKYRISADLASAVYDNALAEKIEPELAFRLVRLESEFHERATSPVGAIGLTQLMLPTARDFQKGISKEALYDRNTNLRIGFRYLRALVREYKDVQLALLVYNRGPAAVDQAREQGIDPSNGYDRLLLRGYKGRGVID